MDTLWQCRYSVTELARIRCDGLYFAELFRRGGYLAQLCQTSVYEGVREDMYVGCVGWHGDCFCQTGREDGGDGDVDNNSACSREISEAPGLSWRLSVVSSLALSHGHRLSL